MKHSFLLLLTLSFFMYSCSSDDDSTPDPDPVTKITYTKNIKTIIDGNCLGCHGTDVQNGASKSLTNYTEVKAASAGVTGKVADGSMPAGGGSLTDDQKKAFADWKKDGFLE